ncbi:hypothetical protein TeGR_g10827 [Tetraparma gracilis]|uniref:S-adenosyl-L-methionine-dependent methyltransferase n=1 Tax=Tetraparma gracilis TaxID=2962635 RepID=A0ABQ6MQG7_9STRA|nr:hypothetical protein TeGR_g10827 [Tetraparma gracilis]
MRSTDKTKDGFWKVEVGTAVEKWKGWHDAELFALDPTDGEDGGGKRERRVPSTYASEEQSAPRGRPRPPPGPPAPRAGENVDEALVRGVRFDEGAEFVYESIGAGARPETVSFLDARVDKDGSWKITASCGVVSWRWTAADLFVVPGAEPTEMTDSDGDNTSAGTWKGPSEADKRPPRPPVPETIVLDDGEEDDGEVNWQAETIRGRRQPTPAKLKDMERLAAEEAAKVAEDAPQVFSELILCNLYSGIGGVCQGVSGMSVPNRIAFAIDNNSFATDTNKHNYPDGVAGDVPVKDKATFITMKITNSPECVQTLLTWVNKVKEDNPRAYVMVQASPPCQSLSTAGTKNFQAQENSLVEIKSLLKVLMHRNNQCDGWFLENVHNKDLIEMCERMEKEGRDLSVTTLHMEDRGLPSRRKRVIVSSNVGFEMHWAQLPVKTKTPHQLAIFENLPRISRMATRKASGVATFTPLDEHAPTVTCTPGWIAEAPP